MRYKRRCNTQLKGCLVIVKDVLKELEQKVKTFYFPSKTESKKRTRRFSSAFLVLQSTLALALKGVDVANILLKKRTFGRSFHKQVKDIFRHIEVLV